MRKMALLLALAMFATISCAQIGKSIKVQKVTTDTLLLAGKDVRRGIDSLWNDSDSLWHETDSLWASLDSLRGGPGTVLPETPRRTFYVSPIYSNGRPYFSSIESVLDYCLQVQQPDSLTVILVYPGTYQLDGLYHPWVPNTMIVGMDRKSCIFQTPAFSYGLYSEGSLAWQQRTGGNIWSVENITIEGNLTASTYGINLNDLGPDNNTVIVRRVTITNMSVGVWLEGSVSGAVNLTVEDCDISSLGGLYTFLLSINSTVPSIIKNTTFRDNGVSVWLMDDARFEGCTFINVPALAHFQQASGKIYYTGCTFFDCAILRDATDGSEAGNNYFDGCQFINSTYWHQTDVTGKYNFSNCVFNHSTNNTELLRFDDDTYVSLRNCTLNNGYIAVEGSPHSAHLFLSGTTILNPYGTYSVVADNSDSVAIAGFVSDKPFNGSVIVKPGVLSSGNISRSSGVLADSVRSRTVSAYGSSPMRLGGGININSDSTGVVMSILSLTPNASGNWLGIGRDFTDFTFMGWANSTTPYSYLFSGASGTARPLWISGANMSVDTLGNATFSGFINAKATTLPTAPASGMKLFTISGGANPDTLRAIDHLGNIKQIMP